MDSIRAALDKALATLAEGETDPQLLLMTRETRYAECAETVNLDEFARYLRDALDARST